MHTTIWAYGVHPDALTDREKERLADSIHNALQEDFGIHPESVGIEGYGGA